MFEAAHIAGQVDLLKSLKADGCEIALDPNFAELGAIGRYQSACSKLPWANSERPWLPSDLDTLEFSDLARKISDFCVEFEIDVLLAPTNLIDLVDDPWINVNFRLCEQVRRELDNRGGRNVSIDYQLITTNALLKNNEVIDSFAAAVKNMPITNLWLRVSGFGATSTGRGTRQYIESVGRLHIAELPLIGDNVGGFSGLAATSFGAIGGLSHGVGLKESFRASDWKRPKVQGRQQAGLPKRIYLHEFDRHFKENQLRSIFSVKGGKSRFACNNSNCCPQGLEGMIDSPHSHFIYQRVRQLEDISRVQDESKRVDHFFLKHLDPAIASASHGSNLKIEDKKVVEILKNSSKRLNFLRESLDSLNADGKLNSRSLSPLFRGGQSSLQLDFGRKT